MTTVPSRPAPQKPSHSLNLSGPIRAGLAAIAGAAALCASALFVEIESGPVTSAAGTIRAEPVVVRHVDGGVIARVHVAAGNIVGTGQLLISLDSRLLESRIAGLRTQSDAIRLRVSGLRQEADALAASDRQSSHRSRLSSLEAQMADIEQEGLGLKVRIAMAEQELKRTEIRSPVAGRIDAAGIASDGAQIKPGDALITVRPSVDRMQLETAWPSHIQPLPGQTVRVWLGHQATLQPALPGQVEPPLGEDAATRVKTRVGVDLAGTAIAETADRTAEHRFDVQLVTGKTSLLAHLFVPLNRRPIETTSRLSAP